MNLHEECLLKYLLNPLRIVQTAELLRLNNAIIEKELLFKSNQNDYTKMKYLPSKI